MPATPSVDPSTLRPVSAARPPASLPGAVAVGGSGGCVGGAAPVAELDLVGSDLEGGAPVAVGVGPFAVGEAAFDEDLVALVLVLGDELGRLAEGDDADPVDRLGAVVAAA